MLGYDAFMESLERLRDESHRLLKGGAHCALIISSRKKNGKYYDLAFEAFSKFARCLTPVERICVPYRNSYSEITGEWASWRMAGKLLRAFRDLMVFAKTG